MSFNYPSAGSSFNNTNYNNYIYNPNQSNQNYNTHNDVTKSNPFEGGLNHQNFTMNFGAEPSPSIPQSSSKRPQMQPTGQNVYESRFGVAPTPEYNFDVQNGGGNGGVKQSEFNPFAGVGQASGAQDLGLYQEGGVEGKYTSFEGKDVDVEKAQETGIRNIGNSCYV